MQLVSLSSLIIAFITSMSLWLVVAYQLGWMSGRMIPASGSLLVLLGLCILLPLCKKRFQLHRFQMRVLILGVVFLVWIAISQLLNLAPVSIWWKHVERLISLAVFVAVICSEVPHDRLFRIFGIASACAVVIAVVPIIWWGGLVEGENERFWWSYGLGHPNQLLNTAGLGAGVFFIHSWFFNRREASVRGDLIVSLIGLIAVVFMAWFFARRGIALAIGVGLLTYFWWSIRLSRPRLFWSILVAGLLVVLGLSYAVAVQSRMEPRFERALIYLSCLERVIDRPIFGYGHYGSFFYSTAAGEYTQLLGSTGSWFIHSHSEFMDALIDGGIPALMLMLGAAYLIIRRAFSEKPGSFHKSMQILITGALVVALIDNAYSRLLGSAWLALVVGLLFKVTPDEVDDSAGSSSLPGMFLWFGALLSAWAFTTMSSLAFMDRDASPSVHLRTVEQTIDPEFLTSAVVNAIKEANREGSPRTYVRRVIEVQERRLGITNYTMYEKLKALYSRPDSKAQAFAVLNELATRLPLDIQVLDFVNKCLTEDRKSVSTIDSIHVIRARVSRGQGVLTDIETPYSTPKTIAEAANLAAKIRFGMIHEGFSPEIRRQVYLLVDRYGNVPEVSRIGGLAIITDPEFELTPYRQRMIISGFRQNFYLPILNRVQESWQAKAISPLLVKLMPGEYADFKRGNISRSWIPPSDSYVERRAEFTRIWGLADRVATLP